jgi:sec-independent protein translocase protein TatA
MPGPSEWIVIAIVALVVIFGAKKIPEIARSLGRSSSEFKKGVKEGAADDAASSEQTSPPEKKPEGPPSESSQ